MAIVAVVGVSAGSMLAFGSQDLTAMPDNVVTAFQTDAWAEYFDPDGSTGTGVFSPFLRTQDNDGEHIGYNSDLFDPAEKKDTKDDPHTHAILKSDIPVKTIDPGDPGGPTYDAFEFVADWNEPNSADEIDLTQFELYCLDGTGAYDGTDIGQYGYPYPDTGYTGPADEEWGEPLFQLIEGGLQLLDHNTGSGDGDFKLWLDTSVLSPCADTDWVVVWTGWGDVSGGFTEWGFLADQTIEVTKDLSVSYTQDISWDLTKEVCSVEGDPDCTTWDDSASKSALAGQSVPFDYNITLDRTDEYTFSFSGAVTVSGDPAGTVDVHLTDTLTYPTTGGGSDTMDVDFDDVQTDANCSVNPDGSADVALTTQSGNEANWVTEVTCSYTGTIVDPDFDPAAALADNTSIENNALAEWTEGNGANEVEIDTTATALDGDGFDDSLNGVETIDVWDDNDVDAFDAWILEDQSGDNAGHEYSHSYDCSNDPADYLDGEEFVGWYSFEVDNTATMYEDHHSTDQVGDPDSTTVTVTCYAPIVTKDADTRYNRYWTWSIDKDVDQDDANGGSDDTAIGEDVVAVELAQGQVFSLWYTIGLTADIEKDDDHAAYGSAYVENPSPFDMYVDLSDEILTVGTATLTNCELVSEDPLLTAAGHHIVPAGDTLVCDYDEDLVDDTSLTNRATVVLYDESDDSQLFTDTSEVDIVFGDPTGHVDECVTVTDSMPGADPFSATSGVVCANTDGGSGQPFDDSAYEVPVDTSACGHQDIINIAQFTTNDESDQSSDTVDVDIDIVCPGGCTLTQGYWKTHNPSFWGGAANKADDAWLALGGETVVPPWYQDNDPDNGTVEIHGVTHDAGSYFAIMWTPSKGSVWYQLAHQMIAAELNVENAAGTAIVETYGYTNVEVAIVAAKALLDDVDPYEISEFKGKDKADFKKANEEFLQLASLFAAYNEGLIGPGHCAEDPVSDLG